MKQLRVLMADDSAPFRRTLQQVLSSLPQVGEIYEAEDGEVALRYVEEYDPDLLLLDIRMPKLDGIQVLQELSARKARVTVFVLSAHPAPVFAHMTTKYGAVAYLSKGDPQGVVDAVKALARRLNTRLH
jgi:DNA-binding NarL/FixJ family response regulator